MRHDSKCHRSSDETNARSDEILVKQGESTTDERGHACDHASEQRDTRSRWSGVFFLVVFGHVLDQIAELE